MQCIPPSYARHLDGFLILSFFFFAGNVATVVVVVLLKEPS